MSRQLQDADSEHTTIADFASNSQPLFQDRSFWGITCTQFLGAFNDNLFKQLVLLLTVGGATVTAVAANGAAAEKSFDAQSVAMVIFAAPFLLFSGYAGYLSEKFSKRTVIVLCKFAEVMIAGLGLFAFLAWDRTGIWGVFVVLFLLGTHSAFFGPGKYGVLPEMFSQAHLPMVNGIVLMTTFLAIIFGTALAGWLKDLWGIEQLWKASIVCLVVALLGTQSALWTRQIPAAAPDARFTWSCLAIPREIVLLLRRDRMLLQALMATCAFWLIGGIVQPAVNAVGKKQFEISDTKTSLLAAAMGVGISIGCLLAGYLSHERVNFRVMKWGAWLTVATLVALAIPGHGKWNLLGYSGSLCMLVLLGGAAGLFVVPIQVFLQSRPPESLKGRTIATMNILNWIAIIISAGLYFAFDLAVTHFGWQRSMSFGFTALLMLPVALLYRPSIEVYSE